MVFRYDNLSLDSQSRGSFQSNEPGIHVDWAAIAPKMAGGSPIDLWWCPPPRYLPLVKALLDTLSCQTMFLMEDNGDGMLSPVGVNFSIPNITFGGKGAHARFWPLSQRK